jgi:hypothetical protein
LVNKVLNDDVFISAQELDEYLKVIKPLIRKVDRIIQEKDKNISPKDRIEYILKNVSDKVYLTEQKFNILVGVLNSEIAQGIEENQFRLTVKE